MLLNHFYFSKAKAPKLILFCSVFLLLQTMLMHGSSNYTMNKDLASFSIGKENGKSDALYQFNPIIFQWVKIGHLNTTGIFSIAIDSENFIIYAVDGKTLGTINPINADFTPIGLLG